MADFADLRKEWDGVASDIQKFLKTQTEEVRLNGESSKETAANIKAAEGRYDSLRADFEEFKAKNEELIIETKRPGFGGSKAVESWGDQLVASEGLKRYVKAGSHGNSSDIILKAALSGTNASDLVIAHRKPGIVESPMQPLRIRDLFTSVPIISDSVDYVTESVLDRLYTEVAVQGESGDSTIALDNAQGFYPGQVVTMRNTPDISRTIDAAGVNLTTNILTFTATLGATVPVDVEVVATSFDFTTELAEKPQANMEFSLSSENVKTLATWIPASRQILSDARALREYVNRRLPQGLALSVEQQLLYGGGGANQLSGIMENTDAQTYSWSSGSPGDTRIDAIRRSLTLSQLAFYPVDGIVLHPTDWEYIELAKGDDNHYIWVTVPSGAPGTVLWRVPVIVTPAIAAGSFLSGAFSMGATIWDREQTSLRIAEQHEDFFIRNMVAILAEERLAFTTERPESFVIGSFDSAPAGP